jgi:hypothetical protein
MPPWGLFNALEVFVKAELTAISKKASALLEAMTAYYQVRTATSMSQEKRQAKWIELHNEKHHPEDDEP